MSINMAVSILSRASRGCAFWPGQATFSMHRVATTCFARKFKFLPVA